MGASHSRRLRRPIALVLALCFGFYSAESLLADVHDGDATHEELAQVEGSGLHAARHAAIGDAQGDAMNDSGEHPSGPSGHDRHACHHAHAHCGWFEENGTDDGSFAATQEPPVAWPDRAPASRDTQPQLRPPIG